MFDLTGRTALVTGASGGIGAASARALSARGARVGLSGTRVEALEQLAGEIGDSARVIPADLSAPDGPDKLMEGCKSELGALDILVCNAGVTRDGLLLRMSDEDWNHVLMVNLASSFRLARSALRGMMKKRWGRIIGITSIVAATGNAGQANYAASKAGMIGMFKSLAQEVAGRGVTANCIAPGFIETNMTAALPAERRDALLQSIPAGRFGQPDDIASSVVYLASDEAAYVTGQTLHVNGGMAMI